MEKRSSCFVLIVTGQTQAVEWCLEKATFSFGGLMRVVTAEAVPLFIGGMNATAAFFFLVTFQAEFLR